jgi:hypothetical protein
VSMRVFRRVKTEKKWLGFIRIGTPLLKFWFFGQDPIFHSQHPP